MLLLYNFYLRLHVPIEQKSSQETHNAYIHPNQQSWFHKP